MDAQTAPSSDSINADTSSTSARSNPSEEPVKKKSRQNQKFNNANIEIQQNLLKEIVRSNNNAEKLDEEIRQESEKFDKYIEELLKIEKRHVVATEIFLEIFEAPLKK